MLWELGFIRGPLMILFGYKSCGKTYLGKLLAQRLALRFIDTDDLVESLFHPRMSCRAISLTRGEETFRILEKKVIHQLDSIAGAVLSVGGGAVLDADNRAHLSSLAPLIYLEIDKETLKKRLLQDELPSYLDPSDPEGSFEKMYEERKKIYENNAHITITLCGKKEHDILEELRSYYEQYIWHNL
jgi:shikimate kinase